MVILGVNGQDGSFLAENLVEQGYEVVGIGRQQKSLKDLSQQLAAYEKLDLSDGSALANMLKRYKPGKIFHVAAVHGSAGTAYEALWQKMLAVNVGSVHVVLEYLRKFRADGTLTYANSGKIFGPKYPVQLSEQSSTQASCLYTITKLAARNLINYYRDKHKLQAGQLFLFNHESGRRSDDFFLPKILNILASAVRSNNYRESLGTLEFFNNWGCAREYMDLMVKASEIAPKGDFVLGASKTLYARSFVEELFQRYGLDYRNHILERCFNPTEGMQKRMYRVNTGKFRKMMGECPRRGIFEVCEEILQTYHGLTPLRG
ncbi:MAG: GDP-mannose 4,6-dehydratase [Nitrososphaerales archaeon]|nr:GDP-mannose 4,6-dehydratase [Nitrososphaerales archaeon]